MVSLRGELQKQDEKQTEKNKQTESFNPPGTPSYTHAHTYLTHT